MSYYHLIYWRYFLPSIYSTLSALSGVFNSSKCQVQNSEFLKAGIKTSSILPYKTRRNKYFHEIPHWTIHSNLQLKVSVQNK